MLTIIVGVAAGVAGITMGAMAWSTDHLITPRGWIVVALTTTCALGVFVGVTGYRDARTREHQLRGEAAMKRAEAAIANMNDAADDLGSLVAKFNRISSERSGRGLRGGAVALAELDEPITIGRVAAQMEETNYLLRRLVDVMDPERVPAPRPPLLRKASPDIAEDFDRYLTARHDISRENRRSDGPEPVA